MIPSVNIIRRVFSELNPAELHGTLMAVPICNPLGAGECVRQTPGDGMNLNDAFSGASAHPGSVRSISEEIARTLDERFLSRLNYHIDLHTGGSNHMVNMIEFVDDPECVAMARAFNMPILLKDGWGSTQMWGASARHGAKVIVAEVGGIHMTAEWETRAVNGIFNVMRCLGMLPGDVQKLPRQYVIDNTPGHEHNLTILRPAEGGLVVPAEGITPQAIYAGQPLEGKRVLGRLVNMYDLLVHQEFTTPFERTLMLVTPVESSWFYPGTIGYIFADADAAEVWE
jgi:predicted deacylase